MANRKTRRFVLPAFCFVAFSIVAGTSHATLVAKYDFETAGGGSLIDKTGNGHNGTLIGTPTFVADADPLRGTVLQNATATNSSNGINIQSTSPIPAFPANTSITLAAWAKRTNKTTSNFRYIMGLGAQGNAPIATLGIDDSSSVVRGYIETDEPVSNGDQVDVIGTAPVESNVAAWGGWHHIAIVYDRGTNLARVYVDGYLDKSQSISAVDDTFAQTWAANAAIGRVVPSASQSWVGRIDDVHIYDEARSQAQIQAIMGGPRVNATITRTANTPYGSLSLTNFGVAATDITSYKLTSPTTGSLLSTQWFPITGHYDSVGNGTFDNAPWFIQSPGSNRTQLAEAANTGSATISPGQTVTLGTPWIQSPLTADIRIEITYSDGRVTNYPVEFAGPTFARSDLNFDGQINATDWPLFYPNALTSLAPGLSAAERYQKGDLNADGFVDVTDFSLFKFDFDVANGAGAFAGMFGSVPEPGSMALLAVGVAAVMSRRRRRNVALAVALAATSITIIGTPAVATPVDFTTFVTEKYPPASGFNTANWTVTANTATVNSNADASIRYSPVEAGSAFNKRYIGLLKAGNDNDDVGFVLGFHPGDNAFAVPLTQIGNYLMINWKGGADTFNFTDPVGGNTFHTRTTGASSAAGLRLLQVTGLPTADELWQRNDQAEDPNFDPVGGVAVLASATTLGGSSYVTDPTAFAQTVDITYKSDRIVVLIDGVKEFDYVPLTGTLPDGQFGLYSAWQGPSPLFANFEVFPADFTGLSAEVNRTDGTITIKNPNADPVLFDYYELSSVTNSLKTSWSSLSDQNFQSLPGGGIGDSWDEAGGSTNGKLAEFFFGGNSTLTGTPVAMGSAYNNTTDGQDIVFRYRMANGATMVGAVTYVGSPPVGIPGDFNGDTKVDAADYVLWRKNPNSFLPYTYDTWRNAFGTGTGSGSSLGGTSVPEPAVLGLALCAGPLLVTRRGKLLVR